MSTTETHASRQTAQAAPEVLRHISPMTKDTVRAMRDSLTMVSRAEDVELWVPTAADGATLPHRSAEEHAKAVGVPAPKPVAAKSTEDAPQVERRSRGASSILFAAFVAIQRIGRRKED